MSEYDSGHIVDLIVEEVCHELCVDWVGLWMIVEGIENVLPTVDRQEMRRLTLDVVRRLVADPRVHAGRPSPTVLGGFDPWPLTPQESVDRIAREWDALARNPIIDEICWFDLT